MTDLVEFLRARLDEDETEARDAHYDGQTWVPEEEAVVAADRDLEPVLFLDRKRDARHAANWSPTRVLTEVEAKRRIIDLAAEVDDMAERINQEWGVGNVDYGPGEGTQLLRLLAMPYADHPDFDPMWK